jgi:HEPN domain-containing protein
MRPETAPWWRQAQADMLQAKRSLQPGGYYASVWFVQQAVEKGLKALIIEQRGTLPERTHDIERLGTTLSVPTNIQNQLATINPVFNRVRYPDLGTLIAPVDSISDVDASEQLEAAEEVMAWLAPQLDPTSTQP